MFKDRRFSLETGIQSGNCPFAQLPWWDPPSEAPLDEPFVLLVLLYLFGGDRVCLRVGGPTAFPETKGARLMMTNAVVLESVFELAQSGN